MNVKEKVLELACKELGTREFPPGSNDVKYNTDYYGGRVQGGKYPWCCVFLWWIFQKVDCPELFFGGKRTAYCPALLTYHQRKGQAVTGDYQPGDIVFFNFNRGSSAQHVGLCESWDGRYITTIDGNTGVGKEANGGAVMRRRREKKYIVGAVRPDYGEENRMTQEEVKKIVQDLEQERQSRKPDPAWGSEAREWALEQGLFVGNEAGELQWEAPVTRNQLATILYKMNH